ncbi:MAG: bifunctional [glutamate--ammonia ligase]-adenylyl-L-tyrosine phosphorylase/[glutamate--ammonia-ligase] adenylyltransferase [Pseudomonadota bacterium]
MLFRQSDLDTVPSALRDDVIEFAGQFETAWATDVVPPGLLPTVVVSEFARRVALAQWDVVSAGLAQSADQLLIDAEASIVDMEPDAVRRELRRFRDRFMLRLLIDELGGMAGVDETVRRLSDLADVAIRIATHTARNKVAERFGDLLDVNGQRIPLVVVAMGKLGGQELNFSSDIDVVFLYPRDGQSDGRRPATAQEYCMRWSQQVVSLLDDVTTDGFVFRVDTRLRPFGDSGPPVCSFAALEQYLLTHGRAWERYAWVKARICGELPSAAEREELEEGLVRPFVYRGYLDYGLMGSLRDMHRRIDAERRDLADNLKLGDGGIRQIEFMVQSLQMLRGGSRPDYRTRGLLDALQAVSGSKEMPEERAKALRDAYRLLRQLENLAQARRDQQVHDLPSSADAQAAIAFALSFDHWSALQRTLDAHRHRVSSEFRALAYPDGQDNDRLRNAWLDDATDWVAELADLSLPEAALTTFAEFREQAMRQRPDDISAERLANFVPTLLALAAEHDDPALVLSRSATFLTGIIRRSAYIALLNENPVIAQRLCDLLTRSAFIAEQLTKHPVLLDELIDSQDDKASFTLDALDAALRDAVPAGGDTDSEACIESLARFQRATLFRIAVAETSGELSLMKASDGLTWLAESVLHVALETAWRDVTRRFGRPFCRVDGVLREAGFGIVAYGKLGGLELSYGSDLDLVFVHDSEGEQQTTDVDKPIDNAVFFARLARRLTHILTTRTTSGVLYDIDTRLRPSGRSGLLVTSLAAFERYQRDDAWTWEHQALLRSRPVAGSPAIANAFETIRQRTLSEYVDRDALARDVVTMRSKMRRELDRSGGDHFDLKQGRGGIADIEFLVQYLVLRSADRYPSTVRYSDNIRQLDALAEAGCIDLSQASRLQDVYRRYRRCVHRRVLDGKDRRVDQQRFVAERDDVVAVWNEFLGEAAGGTTSV